MQYFALGYFTNPTLLWRHIILHFVHGVANLPPFTLLFHLAILVSVSATQEAKIQELKAERDKATSRVSQLEDFILALGQNVPSDSYSSPTKSAPFPLSSSSV